MANEKFEGFKKKFLKKDDKKIGDPPREVPDLLYEKDQEPEELVPEEKSQEETPKQEKVEEEKLKESLIEKEEEPVKESEPKEEEASFIDEGLSISKEISDNGIKTREDTTPTIEDSPIPVKKESPAQATSAPPPINPPPTQQEEPKQEEYQEVQEEVSDDEKSVGISSKNPGFFVKINNIIENNPGDSDKLKEIVNGDLFDAMKEYHKSVEDGEKVFVDHSELEEEIKNNLLELKDLEDEWYEQKKLVEEEEKKFFEKESKIHLKIDELKDLFDLKEEEKREREEGLVGEREAFILRNNQKITSLSELLEELKNMSDEEFTSYVTQEKNDFAGWILNVFYNKKLSEDLKLRKNKKEMIEVLEEHLK
ncbi:hypothetical protein GOV05_02900 [Candidatus Woesearchaeota archaeon]|nr:hypothetical protein [Candidatus Woesearchaeota archaeon]